MFEGKDRPVCRSSEPLPDGEEDLCKYIDTMAKCEESRMPSPEEVQKIKDLRAIAKGQTEGGEPIDLDSTNPTDLTPDEGFKICLFFC